MPAETKDIDLGRINVASTRRIQLTIHKDGVAWTGIDSVLFRFEKPDRSTTFDRTGVLVSDSTGVWRYDLDGATDIPDAEASLGYWNLSVRVTDGSVVEWYPWDIGFEVVDQP